MKKQNNVPSGSSQVSEASVSEAKGTSKPFMTDITLLPGWRFELAKY